ncbi:MAG TPA: RraA family protein [Casimicrobiaceae bacterium]|jgi:regulator of RNase E activity RraA|nr:RraA family protein [Casimicrobiaceae bacterium]
MNTSDPPMRRLEPHELALWQSIPSAVVSDERRHQGVLVGVRPLFTGRPFAAQALTIEVGAVSDGAPRDALALAWSGACMVIDARAAPNAAVWGGNLIRIARDCGIVAVVVDGCVRDVAELRDSGIAVCSQGVTPRGPTWGGHIGGAIHCGGVEINAGDLIVGDDDGVVAVPIGDVNDDLLARCRTRMQREAQGATG